MRLPETAPVAAWPARLATISAGGASTRHAHHALHLVVARRGLLRVGLDGATHEAAGVLTAPDTPHSIHCDEAVVLLFVDPESSVGAGLRAGFEGPARLLDSPRRDALLRGFSPDPAGLADWADRALALLAPAPAPPRMHPRVRRLLAELRSPHPPADTSLSALAARVGLSPSRLQHVFTESVGVPLRAYLLWQKLQRAGGAIAAGHPLSEAALLGGFSDAAHMSRTFRRMLGVTPSALQQR